MSRTLQLARVLLAGVAGAALLVASPVPTAFVSPASAQAVAISVEFRAALAPYGTWRRVPRWGEVWIPARVSRDWLPYSVGHWVYTEDYGWYWISAEAEAEWGWITFHYGRWVVVEPYGWVWVPGNVWGPAWVDWRYGDEHVGWAPLPPDEIIVAYRADPAFWLFVRVVDLIAPRPRYVFAPFGERRRFWQQTVLVNSTVFLSQRRFAVNPGIPPQLVAARARQPLRTFTVRPQVVAGTANIEGAVQIREQDIRRGGDRPGRLVVQQRSVQQAATAVQPAQNVAPPRALGPNERGRLGDNPPRAATGTQERGTTGAPPPAQREAPLPRGERDRVQPGAPGGQTPSTSAPSEPPRDGAAPGQDRQRTQERLRQQPPGTTGAPPAQRREAPAMRDDRDQMPERGTSRSPGTTGAMPPMQQREAPQPREQRQQAAPPPQAPTGRQPSVQQPQPPAQAAPRQAPRTPAAQPRQVPEQPATTGSGAQREREERQQGR